MDKDQIIYKLIILLYDENTERYQGIDDEDFVQHVCQETGMSEVDYYEAIGM